MRVVSAVFAFFAVLFACPLALLDWSGDGKVDPWVWDIAIKCAAASIMFFIPGDIPDESTTAE